MEEYEVNWKNYYDILGVSPTADAQEIKAAYRGLALKHHPDRTEDSLASGRMAEINEAYEVLSDPTRKASYDRLFESIYGTQKSRIGRPVYETRETSDIKVTLEEEKKLPWIIPVASFCSLFLVGIFISIAREQLVWTAIWLSFLWALFSFGAIFMGRALVTLLIRAIKRGIKPTITKASNIWEVMAYISIGIFTLAAGYGAVMFLRMLLFERIGS